MVDEERRDNPEPEYFERLTKAIESSVDNGEIVTKWTVIVEVIDADGDRGLWAVSDEHSTVWDTLGMLSFAAQKAKSKVDMVTWAQSSVEFNEDDE